MFGVGGRDVLGAVEVFANDYYYYYWRRKRIRQP